MKRRLGVFFALAISGVVLASCSGNDSYMPPALPDAAGNAPQYQNMSGVSPEQAPMGQPVGGQPQAVPQQENMPSNDAAPPNDLAPPGEALPPDQAPPTDAGTPPQSVAATAPHPPQKVARANAVASAPHCPTAMLPGTYTVIIAQGHVTGTTFTAATGGGSLWERRQYVATKNGSKPNASSSPQSRVLYTGTFTVNNAKGKVDTVGCAMLIAMQNTADIKGAKFSAQNTDNPVFAKPTHNTLVASGVVTKLTITGLSKAGGTGTFVLSNKFTGTIRLTSRSNIP